MLTEYLFYGVVYYIPTHFVGAVVPEAKAIYDLLA